MPGECAQEPTVLVNEEVADKGRIIEYINKHEGVEWVTMEQMCDDFKVRNPPPPGAKLPIPAEDILKQHQTQVGKS